MKILGRNFLLTFLLFSLVLAQEQGNTVAVLVFEGRGISLSESTTLSDRFRTALADIRLRKDRRTKNGE